MRKALLLTATLALAGCGGSRDGTKIGVMVNQNDFGIQGSFTLTPAPKP